MELRAVMVREDFFNEPTHHVVPEVRGEVAEVDARTGPTCTSCVGPTCTIALGVGYS